MASVEQLLAEARSLPAGDYSGHYRIANQITVLEQDVIPDLIPLLNSEDDLTRHLALHAIGLLADRRAVPALLECLRGPYNYLNTSAIIWALGKTGDTRATQPLIDYMRAADWIEKEAAARALGMLGDQRAVEPVIEQLEDAQLRVEIYVEVLAELGDERAIDPIIASFERGGTIAHHIAKFGSAALAPLRVALDHSHGSVRAEACLALGYLKDTDSVQKLIDFLNGFHEVVAEAAATALGEIGDERAIPPLIAALDDSNEYYAVRVSAATAIGKIIASGTQKTDVSLPQKTQDNVSDALLRALDDTDSRIQQSAVQAIALTANPRLIEPLVSVLTRPEDVDDRVREAAIVASGQFGVLAVPEVIGLLLHADSLVRHAAVRTLVLINEPEATNYLVESLTDPSDSIREIAAIALSKDQETGIDQLFDALVHEDRDMRMAAALAIGKAGSDHLERLLELAETTETGRDAVVHAIGRMGDLQALDALLGWLSDDDPHVRAEATGGLEVMYSHDGPGDRLRNEKENPDMYERATADLEKLANQDNIEQLIDMLTDKESSVRWSALRACRRYVIGNARARQLIEAMATNDPEPWLRDAARVSLELEDSKMSN
ncbi:MAG: HEAT repeat domain-containing protein [Chloroflexota bacterium]